MQSSAHPRQSATKSDKVPNVQVLVRAGLSTMYTLLRQRRLRWLGHVRRMEDGRIPKGILYGELASGKRSAGSVQERLYFVSATFYPQPMLFQPKIDIYGSLPMVETDRRRPTNSSTFKVAYTTCDNRCLMNKGFHSLSLEICTTFFLYFCR